MTCWSVTHYERRMGRSRALSSAVDDTTDRQIDQLVYQLYDLTAEEIKIVEESLK